MARETEAVFVGERYPGLPAQFGAYGFAELRREARLAVFVERDEGAVEGRVEDAAQFVAVEAVCAGVEGVEVGSGPCAAIFVPDTRWANELKIFRQRRQCIIS